ncbi:MAG TPA: thiamine phosphate synthase [Kofleriaceae bacterium]|nr:thiamine phosphate synthase [Kofleriaceae bacterium]
MIRGFYAVLDRDDEQLARRLVTVARVLQVRLKPADPADIVRVARMARRICDASNALLIVNDRVDIALAVGADGVHLGQSDLPLRDARALAPRLIIGVSTHDLAQVRAAVDDGADYLGFGPVYPTRTKKHPDPVQGLAGLRAAVELAGNRPIVAIGGIGPEHAMEVYATGASAICAISAVNNAIDVTATAERLQRPPGHG